MKRKRGPAPGRHHDVRHEVEQVVDSCGVPREQREAYLAFALELARSLRRGEPQATSRKPQASGPAALSSGLWSLNSDFSVGTKCVVAKWFRRGLSGHLMWLVGQALLSARPGHGREQV